jgi:predicted transposase/invertase (TIGR01784 family)
MLKDKILTYSEEAELRGKKEGIKEGVMKVARSMLTDGLSLEMIGKYTGLDERDILALGYSKVPSV